MNDEDLLRALAKQPKDHATACEGFPILKRLCLSLTSSSPDPLDSPCVWCLDELAETFEEDSKLITDVLGHRIVEMGGLSFEGGPPSDPLELDRDMLAFYAPRGDEAKIRTLIWEILQRRCPSLASPHPEPIKRHPTTWQLDPRHANVDQDRLFIIDHLPGHVVVIDFIIT